EITIIAERPAVDLDMTGSEIIMGADALERSPIQKLEDVVLQQRGVFHTGTVTYIRGGLGNELKYNMDGTSVSGGVVSNNWKSLNTTAVQEVSFLTGGFNAEYGDAMSGIVNVVTKEAPKGHVNINGALRYRHRPAGQYHWGQNMFDHSLKKYTDYDLAFFQESLEAKPDRYNNYLINYFNWDADRNPTPEEAYQVYLHQRDGQKILIDYDKRASQEVEGTLYGSFLKNMTFLISGNYKRGVSIFPTYTPYQPEYNIQGKVTYHFNDNMKLTLNGIDGWYESTEYRNDNVSSSREIGRSGWAAVPPWMPDPYLSKSYWTNWGEEKEYWINVYSVRWQHIINKSTFYTVGINYYADKTQTIQDYLHRSHPQEKLDESWSWNDITSQLQIAGGGNSNKIMEGKSISFKADLTSQINKNHQIKSGLQLNLHDMGFTNISVAHLGINRATATTNIWDGNPIEMAAYLQDKIEYKGIILNVGLRLDGFDTRRKFPENPLFDPLGIDESGYPTNTSQLWFMDEPAPYFASVPDVGYGFYLPDMTDFDKYLPEDVQALLSDQNTIDSEWKFALAPRFGVSFPMTETSKIRFSYGHFYQRPSWSKFYGAVLNFMIPNDDPGRLWENLKHSTADAGYWGQPGLTYEKSIQYEVGYDQEIIGIRLNFTAYYKDQTRLTRFSNRPLLDYGPVSDHNMGGGIATLGFAGQDISMRTSDLSAGDDVLGVKTFANDIYKDTRGLEINVEKLYSNNWTARLTFDYGQSSGGKYGFQVLQKNATDASSIGFAEYEDEEINLDWASSYKFKGNLTYVTPEKLAYIFGNIALSMYYEYFAGPLYTYYPVDYTGIQYPNNKRWVGHQRTDMKLSKRISLHDLTWTLGLEVRNLFNDYDRAMVFETDEELRRWIEDGEIPPHDVSEEPNIWNFYNSLANPKRMIYFTLGLEW
ncbi:TonB-dependent receptor plug domain-containing protein, partial [bacterium]